MLREITIMLLYTAIVGAFSLGTITLFPTREYLCRELPCHPIANIGIRG